MPTRNINLTPHFDRLVEEEVGSGRYGSASEVVREGLRLLEAKKKADEAKLEKLRAMARVAMDQIARGESTRYETTEELEEAIEKIGREASQAFARRRRSPGQTGATAR